MLSIYSIFNTRLDFYLLIDDKIKDLGDVPMTNAMHHELCYFTS